jgi:hypothetical protein
VLYGFVAALVIIHIYTTNNLEKSLIIEEVRLTPRYETIAHCIAHAPMIMVFSAGDREHAPLCQVQRISQHHPRFRSSRRDKEDEREEVSRTQQTVSTPPMRFVSWCCMRPRAR